ncbi:hypothetical protein B0O80DRAFT_7055 [Mortierella sp. GBAus27b]|nr:hypothetical protein B0O80DRAFT_7055 [Mortierella sp. GBAus27b]
MRQRLSPLHVPSTNRINAARPPFLSCPSLFFLTRFHFTHPTNPHTPFQVFNINPSETGHQTNPRNTNTKKRQSISGLITAMPRSGTRTIGGTKQHKETKAEKTKRLEGYRVAKEAKKFVIPGIVALFACVFFLFASKYGIKGSKVASTTPSSSSPVDNILSPSVNSIIQEVLANAGKGQFDSEEAREALTQKVLEVLERSKNEMEQGEGEAEAEAEAEKVEQVEEVEVEGDKQEQSKENPDQSKESEPETPPQQPEDAPQQPAEAQA